MTVLPDPCTGLKLGAQKSIEKKREEEGHPIKHSQLFANDPHKYVFPTCSCPLIVSHHLLCR